MNGHRNADHGRADTIRDVLNRTYRSEDYVEKVMSVFSSSEMTDIQRIVDICVAVGKSYNMGRGNSTSMAVYEAVENCVDIAASLTEISKRIGRDHDNEFGRILRLANTVNGTDAYLVFDRMAAMIGKMNLEGPESAANYETMMRACSILERYGKRGGIGISEYFPHKEFMEGSARSIHAASRIVIDEVVDVVGSYTTVTKSGSNAVASELFDAAMKAADDPEMIRKFMNIIEALGSTRVRRLINIRDGSYLGFAVGEVVRLGFELDSADEIIERANIALEHTAGMRLSGTALVEDMFADLRRRR